MIAFISLQCIFVFRFTIIRCQTRKAVLSGQYANKLVYDI